ncbi:MAG: AraC family transcriptional regulator [Hyphomicrobium sp.]|nr:AraC family transcriptional regulator [Hyphomicrobium sp.]
MIEMPRLISLSFDDAGTFASALTQADVSCTQTAAGPIQFDLAICANNRLQLHFTSMPVGSCVAVGKTADNAKCFHIPLGNTSLVSMLGRKMDAASLAVYEDGGEHAVRAADGASLAYIAASKELVHQVCEMSGGMDFAAAMPATHILSSDPEKMVQLRYFLEEISKLFSLTPIAIANFAVFRNIEQTLMTLLLSASGCDEERNSSAGRTPVSRGRILRKIEELLRERAGEPLYVTDLCAATGVSQPTLYRIFSDVLDMNPKRYLQLRRLHLVREKLLHDPNPARTVSSVAYDCGFWQLGRFGRDYRAHFGETPSHTLRRARTFNIGRETAASLKSQGRF